MKNKTRFWRGSNSRPSACKADVITTTPQNHCDEVSAIFPTSSSIHCVVHVMVINNILNVQAFLCSKVDYIHRFGELELMQH